MSSKFTIIAAVDSYYGLSKSGTAPWSTDPECYNMYSEYKRYLLMATSGGAVLMGRKTYEHIGGPLKGCLNIVLSRSYSCIKTEGVLAEQPLIFVNSLSQAVERCKKFKNRYKKRYVIGSANLIKQIISKNLWNDGKIINIVKDNGTKATYDCDVFLETEFINKYQTVGFVVESKDKSFPKHVITSIKNKNSEEKKYISLIKDVMNQNGRLLYYGKLGRCIFGTSLSFNLYDYRGRVMPLLSTMGTNWIKSYNNFISVLNTNKLLHDIVNDLHDNYYSQNLFVTCCTNSKIYDLIICPNVHSFQFFVTYNDKEEYILDILINSKSSDLIVEIPHVIASYAILAHVVSFICGMKPGTLRINLANTCIMENDYDMAYKILSADRHTAFPVLKFGNRILSNAEHKLKDFYKQFTIDDYELEGYHPVL